jgi:cytochrome c oxidase subunit 2
MRAAALALLMLFSAAAFAEDYSYCTTCHGADGNGNVAIRAPKISGMEDWYLRRQLEHFRAGARGVQQQDVSGQEMQSVAAALKDPAAINGAVTYAVSFKPKTPPVTVQGNAERGRALFETCAACHGAKAEGNAALHAPSLINQSDWYLVTQLERYRAGLRGYAPNDSEGAQMRAIAATLPDSVAVADVISYINTLR